MKERVRQTLLAFSFALTIAACADERVTYPLPAPRAARRAIARSTEPTPEAPFRLNPPVPQLTDDTPPPPIREVVLPNGLRALFVERHGLPVVSMRAAIAGGADDASPGIAAFLSELLVSGTKTRSKDVLRQSLTEMGATWHVNASNQATDLDVKVPSPNVADALDRLADILQNARFPKVELENARRTLVASLDSANSSPAWRAWMEARRLVDPEAKSIAELRTAFALVGPADVENFFRSHVTPDRTLLVFAGDFQTTDLSALVTKKLGGWRGASAPLLPSHVVSPNAKARVIFVDHPGDSQAAVVITAFAPADPRDPDRVALRALSLVLGGGMTGRLGNAVREHYGVTYGADAALTGHRTHGLFVVSAELETERAALGVRELLSAVAKIRDEAISEPEIKEARARTAARAFSTVDSTIGTLSPWLLSEKETLNEFLSRNLSPPPISPEELKRVASAYLASNRLQVAMVGDASRVIPQLPAALLTLGTPSIEMVKY
jgi:zinc protease